MSHFTLFLVIATLAISGYSAGNSIKMPPSCENSTYCTIKPEDYEIYAAAVDKAIHKNKYWAGPNYIDDDTDKQHFNIDDSENCGSVTTLLKPYIIKAEVNTTQFKNKLVVQTENFWQKINITECYNIDESKQCFDTIKGEQGNIETKCEQNYATITLYVFENDIIQPQPFMIPVSCSCRIQFRSF